MPASRSSWQSALTLGFSVAGSAALLWALWKRWGIPSHEHEARVPFTGGTPLPIPDAAKRGLRPIQLTADGTGPLFHRRYTVDIRNPKLDAEALMAAIQADVDALSPGELAYFEKVEGHPERMTVGDEYYIHITGPWDGPVRVIDVTPTSFALVTLEGHLEAGEISFNVLPRPTDTPGLRFEIRSWARSHDGLIAFSYEMLGVSKMAQTKMWTFFCDKVVDLSGGELDGEVEIVTEEAPFHGEVIPGETGEADGA